MDISRQTFTRYVLFLLLVVVLLHEVVHAPAYLTRDTQSRVRPGQVWRTGKTNQLDKKIFSRGVFVAMKRVQKE